MRGIALLAEREADYDFRAAKRIKLGAAMSAADYIDLHHQRRKWIMRMEQAMAPFDAFIVPSTPIVALPIAELEASEETFFKINALLQRNPSVINLLDGCAVSLPCHAQGSLPAGLMIAGTAMTHTRVLAIARVVGGALRAAR
jgi:aspartyl-tRNA(Asn)/glutamyl-tRNA(Gln) amidotransferase subunit A